MFADDDRAGMQQYRSLRQLAFSGSSEELSESYEKVSEPTNTIDGPIEETNYDFNNSSEEITESYEEVSEAVDIIAAGNDDFSDSIAELSDSSEEFTESCEEVSEAVDINDDFSNSIAELNDSQGEDILKVIVKTSISHVFKPLESKLSLLQVCKHFY